MVNEDFVFEWSKELAYFFGYLWADGYIERGRTLLEIVEEDALVIIDDIRKINFLKICYYSRVRKNRKPQMTIYFCNSKFYDNFQSLHFKNKKISSPISLLNLIPEEIKRYFFIGYIDGDGCFYLSRDSKTRQFYITSHYEQDWTHVIELFDKINIKNYEVRKIINKNGNKSSFIRVKKYEEILFLYNYLYPENYEIGLKRKFDKCLEIVKNKPKRLPNTYKIDSEDLIEKIDSGLNIYQISEIYNCNWRKIYEYAKKNNIKYGRNFFSSK